MFKGMHPIARQLCLNLASSFINYETLGKSYNFPASISSSMLLLLLLLSHFSHVRLRDPIDGSPPSFSVPGILQARILEWAAISFSNACMHAKSLQLCLTLCDPMSRAAHQAPLSSGFSSQEYWSGLLFPSPFLIYNSI